MALPPLLDGAEPEGVVVSEEGDFEHPISQIIVKTGAAYLSGLMFRIEYLGIISASPLFGY